MNAGTLHDYALSIGLPLSWCDSTGALHFVDGTSRKATKAEIDGALQAEQNKFAKVIESDTARSEAKQAYSELQPLIEHKDPAIALLAAIMQKHLLATLGR